MILVSRVDKTRPRSPFKRLYGAARQKQTPWQALFLSGSPDPIGTPPGMSPRKRTSCTEPAASMTYMSSIPPRTPRPCCPPPTTSGSRRSGWISVIKSRVPRGHRRAALPDLEVYALPQSGRFYVIGADPAEGNPTSDDSALTVLDRQTGEEVAALAGKLQPSTLAAHADAIGAWYNKAPLLVERNNHGHAVLLWRSP